MTPDPDRLVNVLIARAVRGEPSPWPTDPAFKWKGSFEATLKAGDKQILLWAIEDYARRGVPVEKWAAQALHGIMFDGVARCRLESWDDAFGPIRAKGQQQRKIETMRHMAAVWIRVCELNKSSSDWEEIFETVSRESLIGVGKAKRYYSTMKRFMEKHGPEVWTELERESDRD